ncbi:MAG: gliding motility-associated C-terminal domain-containing protein [Bacteroidota bacterium]|nr:gliding motility-associated C-terminal domain-containing protein [Bacteroidota bacterium]
MKTFVLTILTLVFSYQISAQKIQFKRVCRNGTSNNLYWQLNPDTCLLYSTITLVGSEPASSFNSIDSGITTASLQYTHIAANIPTKKDWKYFLQYRVICGADTLLVRTDTLSVDTSRAEPTFLDSVSINPITNTVSIGWSSNKSPDFNSYYLYNAEKPDPRLAENYLDTFYLQINPPINPKNGSLTYDIASADSCDNRQVYNSPHKTIWLTTKIDTCVNDVSIAWTSYFGWPSIKMQYLYRNLNGSGYVLYDSILPGLNAYVDKTVQNNSSFEYFLRAVKLDTARYISSSSNSALVLSGKSIQPSNTLINYVSNNNANKLEIEINPNPIANYSAIDLYRFSGSQSPAKIYSFSPGETLYEDLAASNQSINRYFLVSKNTCGQTADSSAQSNNIVLNVNESNGLIDLFWNRYFTWNGGVKEYIVFSASGATLTDAINFTALKSVLLDTFINDLPAIDNVVCFYIEAIENNNTTISKSNILCHIKVGQIYFPNAIVLSGTNNHFTFKGLGIDLANSSIQIFNRWGSLVYGKQNITDGWYGTTTDNIQLDEGVYVFIAHIYQAGVINTIHGNITILK